MTMIGPRPLAVLYADVHGYTRLIELDEIGTLTRLTRSLALIRGLICDYGGSVANTAGDGIVAVFGSADMALHFALELQQELARDAAWTGGGAAIAYRIGISVGDTYIGADGVYGHNVNLAARVQGFASPGGICITDAVHALVQGQPALILHPLGAMPMKNIAAPVPVYAVTRAAPAPPPARPAPPSADPLALPDGSVAVLPFDMLTGEPSDRLVGQGFVADLITNLSRFRNLTVIARHSSVLVAAHARRAPDIGRRLGVRYLLGGSFRRMDQRLRITVELTEAATGNVIWAERYDGALAEIFDFQDDVAAMTATRVAIHLEAAERRWLQSAAHPRLDAYGLVLRGEEMSGRFRTEANLHARRLLEQARGIDPAYARSLAAMSRTFNLEWRYHWSSDPAASLDRAVELARQAATCDPLDARGFAELGFSQLYSKRHDESVAAYGHALDLNPNDADLLNDAGNCFTYVRQVDRGLALIQRAMRLNPYHPDSYLWALGGAYFIKGDYAQAIQTVTRMRDQSEGHRLLAASYALLGEADLARHHGREVLRKHPNFTLAHWRNVPPYAHAQDIQPFVAGLAMAGLK